MKRLLGIALVALVVGVIFGMTVIDQGLVCALIIWGSAITLSGLFLLGLILAIEE